MDIPFLVLGSPAPHTVLRPWAHTQTNEYYTVFNVQCDNTYLNKISLLIWQVIWLPTKLHTHNIMMSQRLILWLILSRAEHLVWIRRPVIEIICEVAGWQRREGGVDHGGSNPIEPCPLIGLPGCSECRPRQLLTVKAVWTHLRVVLTQKQRWCNDQFKVPLNCVGVRWGIWHLNHIKVISEVHVV